MFFDGSGNEGDNVGDRELRGLLHEVVHGVPGQSGSKNQYRSRASSAVVDPATGWYRRWYSLLRLDEELEKARLYDRPISVITIKIQLTATGPVALISDRLRERLTSIASEALRPADFPASLGDDGLAIYLPNTDRDGAESVLERLRMELEEFNPRLGLASFPEQGRYAHELLVVATQCLVDAAGVSSPTSDEDEARPLAPVIDLEAYRRRRGLALIA